MSLRVTDRLDLRGFPKEVQEQILESQNEAGDKSAESTRVAAVILSTLVNSGLDRQAWPTVLNLVSVWVLVVKPARATGETEG